MNQSLVDDFLVFSDKIGSANFFWSFPSKAFQDLSVRKISTQASINLALQTISHTTANIAEAKGSRCAADRGQIMAEFSNLKSQNDRLDGQLDQLKVNDPEEIKRVGQLALTNKAAADRWTDNVWQIKSFLTKRKGMAGKEVSVSTTLHASSTLHASIYCRPTSCCALIVHLTTWNTSLQRKRKASSNTLFPPFIFLPQLLYIFEHNNHITSLFWCATSLTSQYPSKYPSPIHTKYSTFIAGHS